MDKIQNLSFKYKKITQNYHDRHLLLFFWSQKRGGEALITGGGAKYREYGYPIQMLPRILDTREAENTDQRKSEDKIIQKVSSFTCNLNRK